MPTVTTDVTAHQPAVVALVSEAAAMLLRPRRPAPVC